MDLSASQKQSPAYPITISKVASNHYYVYDAPKVAHLRAEHRIPGVLTGTLPQSPQQNVFSGLPLQLMPEEARLLVEQGVAHLVDDFQVHKNAFSAMGKESRKAWRDNLRTMGKEVANGVEREKFSEREKVLKNMTEERREKAKKAIARKEEEPRGSSATPDAQAEDEDESIFSGDDTRTSTPPTSVSPTPPPRSQPSNAIQPYSVTPTTSYPPFSPPPRDPIQKLPETPASYALYKYLHTHPSHTFFISPGLRFGCQYLVYPGDPLRFHSHFLASSWDWDEEVPLLTLIGGGRLGTGVKKGFLVGGPIDDRPEEEATSASSLERAEQSERPEEPREGEATQKDVRCFTIEWAGM